jgi:hypothetical protein
MSSGEGEADLSILVAMLVTWSMRLMDRLVGMAGRTRFPVLARGAR